MNDKKIRLLLVEDDKVDQMAFERFVKNMALPYDYTIAGSIAEAKKILKSDSFDVIISDFMLGDGTSFELFDLFKGLPVIVTTGTGNEEIAVEAMKLGACDYLIKDPDGNYLKILPATVELSLKRKQTEKELRNHQENLEFMVKERTAELQTEIIERKKVEEKLRTASQLNERIIESSPIGILIFNSAGDCVTANDSAAKPIGATREQVLQQNYHQIDSWKQSGLYDAALNVIQKQAKKHHEIKVKSTFGKTCTLDTHLVPINIDNVSHLLLMFDDITERKLSEEKIARLGQVFEDSLNEIYLFETDTLKFTQVNNAAQKNLGYSMEELQELTPLDIKPEFTTETFEESLAPLRNGETKKIVLETVHQRKDQSFYDVEVHLQLLKHGYETLFAAIILDITEKKKLKAQFQQAQKMESVGRLAGGVAHDYNNALSVIIGFTEMAIDDVSPNEPLHANLNEILAAANRAAEITRQLLAFARKQTIAPKVLDLNESLESMLKMLRRLIGEDIDLAWLPGTSLWPVKLDPSQIDQILANLCVNARDAIGGVGKVTIETRNADFNDDYCKDHPGFNPGGFVQLAVSDNGCGMDKEILDNIFEPFFTTKDVDKGTGLGLATVYGIVKQNNGFINVYSEPDKGTTIRIYLPRHEGEADGNLEQITTEIPTGHGETVLVVEDDLQILKLARKILEGLNYTVLTAGTPGKALELTKTHVDKIHLLVTDVIMPEMNGRELAQQMKSLYPELKRVFMSGYTANVIAHHGVLDKGVRFIQKPFSRRDLAITVRKAIESE